MKVLWLSHFVPYPPKGGMLSRSYNLLREVSKYHEIHLLALIQVKPLKTMFEDVNVGLDEAYNHLADFCEKVEFVEMPGEGIFMGQYLIAAKSLFSKLSYSCNWFISDDMKNAVKRVTEENNIDFIHFDTIGLAPYADRVSHIPRSLTHHNVESHMMLRRAAGEKNWLKKLYFFIEGAKLKKYEAEVCSSVAVNITCSVLDTERLLEVCGELDVVEVPNGVDVEYFKALDAEITPNSVIFVGGLNWYPNLAAMEFFVDEVWPLLKNRCSDVVVDIVGQDPPEHFLRLAEEDTAFRVHGFVDDVRPYISKAAVYVCPINDGGGTKLKILDALAMEKAIVANPISCEGIEVVENESVLFATEAEEYVNQIVKLFEDENLRSRMGAKGRNLVSELYSFKSLGKRLADLYLFYGEEKRP